MQNALFKVFLASCVTFTAAFPASAEVYYYRFTTPASWTATSPAPVEGEDDISPGVGNDITAYFTGAIGFPFSKSIPVETHDVVLWQKSTGTLQPGLSLDPETGVISGTATGSGSQRKATLLGYDAAGNAIARARLNFSFHNPVGTPSDFSVYGHVGKSVFEKIPSAAQVSRWESLAPLPEGFAIQGAYLKGLSATPLDETLSFVGYDGAGKEVAFADGSLLVEAGPTFPLIADRLQHPSDAFKFSVGVNHAVGKLDYRLIGLDGQPSTLGVTTKGVLSGSIPTFNTSLRFQVQAIDADGAMGISNVFTLSTPAPDVGFSSVGDQSSSIGKPFSLALTAEDLSGEQNWSVIQGSLPAGVSLDPETGVVSGTPTNVETLEGIVIAVSTSDNGYGQTPPFSFAVYPEELRVSFTGLDKRVGESFTSSPPVFGGGVVPPYSFSSADGASVSDGLTVDYANGTASGAIQTAGRHDVSFAFLNGDGREATYSLPIGIYNALSLGYDSTVSMQRKSAANALPTLSDNSVIGNASYEIATGTLPDGVTLSSATGAISGTPTTVGKSEGISVRLTDGSGASSVSNTFSIDVADRAAITATAVDVSAERFVKNSVAAISSENAVDGVTYTLSEGTLPDGLSLSKDGYIVGSTETEEGTTTGLVATATDGEGYTARTNPFSITLKAPEGLAALAASDVTFDWTVDAPFIFDLPRPSNGFGQLTYVLDGLPSGVSVSNGKLEGAIGDIGYHNFPMTITDEARRTITATLSLNIMEPMTASLSGTGVSGGSAMRTRRCSGPARYRFPAERKPTSRSRLPTPSCRLSIRWRGSFRVACPSRTARSRVRHSSRPSRHPRRSSSRMQQERPSGSQRHSR